METNEQNRITELLRTETEKINPDVFTFSLMLENIPNKNKPIISEYFSKFKLSPFKEYFVFEKKTLVFAGSLALIAFIMIAPQMTNRVGNFPDADDLVTNLTANSVDEDDYLLGSTDSMTLTSFDTGTSSDITNLSI